MSHADSGPRHRARSLSGTAPRHRGRRIGRVAAIAAPLACLSILAAAPSARTPDRFVVGLRYDIRRTVTTATTEEGEPGGGPDSAVAHVQMASGKVRIDVISGEFVGLLSSGDYMIFNDTSHVVLIFKPTNTQYFQVDLQKLNAGLTNVANTFGAGVGVEASNVKIEVASLGPGERVGPLSTVKYRLTQDYALTVALMGMRLGATKTMHSTTDYWFATQLTTIVNPFAQTVQGTAWLGADYGKQLAAAQAKLQKGVPVKEVTTEVVTDATDSHVTTTTTTTWELTDFTRTNVPDTAFQIPAGYTQSQAPQTPVSSLTAGNPTMPSSANDSTTSPTGAALRDAVKKMLQHP